MTKCEYYYIFTWAEPPLEPDKNGTKHSEGRCKKRKGYNKVYCEGLSDCCELLEAENERD